MPALEFDELAQPLREKLCEKNEEKALALHFKFLLLRAQKLVEEFKSVKCVFEEHEKNARFRVVAELRARQHGARQFLVLERARTVYALHCDFHGDARELQRTEKFTLICRRRA